MEHFQGSKSDFRISSGLIHLNKVPHLGAILNSILPVISMRFGQLDVHILNTCIIHMYLQHFTIQNSKG